MSHINFLLTFLWINSATDSRKSPSTLVGKVFFIDEIRKERRTGALKEEPNFKEPITNTYKLVCDRLLTLYRTAHNACVAKPKSLANKKIDIDHTVKKVLKLEGMNEKNNGIEYEYTIAQNFQYRIVIIKNLPSSQPLSPRL